MLGACTLIMISEREIIAVKCCLNPESIRPEPIAGHQIQHLHCCKLESEALQLKQDGNDLFRKKKFLASIHKYTMAILQAPWCTDLPLQSKIMDEYLMSLQQVSPAKYEVAKRLHSTPQGSTTCQDASGRQSTPLLATCFGNRSAALYELGRTEECLIDIEHAIHHGYVVTSQEDKLMRRREKCLAKLRQNGKSSKEHHSLIAGNRAEKHSDLKLFNAFESEHVTVQSHHTCGRYIQAVHDLQPGVAVLSEEPYAAILDNQFVHSHCSFCFTESLTLIPCCCCSSEGYCCPDCREEAWKRYHWMECPVARLWKKTDWMMQLCLRIVLRADTKEILSVVSEQNDKSNFSATEYGSLHSLVTHKDKFIDEPQRLLLEKMSSILTGCFGDVILGYLQAVHTRIVTSLIPTDIDTDSAAILPPSLVGLRQLFHHHLLQLRCNSHFILVIIPEECSELSTSHSAVESTTEQKIGSVVYPTASLMNHSCAPNAIFRFIGNKVIVSVTEEVKAGQEINNSYGPQIGRMKRSDRQEMLRRKYFFDCNCVACSGSHPDLANSEVVRDALLCPKCQSGPLQLNSNGLTGTQQSATAKVYHCLQCCCSLSSEQLSTSIQIRAKAQAIFKEATAGNTINIPLLLKCLKQQSGVLYRHNLELAKTNDTLAQAFAIQGDFKSAVCYCQQSCEAVGVVYGNNSVEVADEKEKLSQLLFHSGCHESALKTAREAKQLLLIYRGERYQGCQELEEIIKLLS